jgi:signal transduction histidine kinase
MELFFSVKSGLKDIIGNDLILDDFIAVFELVKNSFDAHASRVKIIFGENKIVIWDNGKGMNATDINEKWLSVAYSAKKEGLEDKELNSNDFRDYRDKISPSKYFAGAKGIGRFSSDRLGKTLLLTSKKASKKSEYKQLLIDWSDFEKNPTQRFEEVRINQIEAPNVEQYNRFSNGTILEITNLRSFWSRDKIIDLKHSLEKLINPFDSLDGSRKTSTSKGRKFTIEIESSKDKAADEKEPAPRDRVNGPVNNFVFETLGLKTTQLFTEISQDGKVLTTELIDRDNLIYRIRENNPYRELSDVRMHLYYLNFSAKVNFKKLMGVESVKFGSVFLYKNGFRIYPFGEQNNDSFGIDRRKQQGYSRFLGTRDIVGRIELFGNDLRFQETSSRDGGLKATAAYLELVEAFLKKCFYRLERYVVDIQWFLKDQANDNISAIRGSFDAKKRILNLIDRLVDSDDIVLEEYGKGFLNIINEKLEEEQDVPVALEALERLGNKTKDKAFVQQLKKARKEYSVLKTKKEKATARAREEEQAREQAERELELERQKNTYLLATRRTLSPDAEGLIHNIVITTKAIGANVETLIDKIRNNTIKENEIIKRLSTIKYNSDKAQKISKLITRANFQTQAEKQITDIAKYVEQYILQYNEIYEVDQIKFEVVNHNATLVKKVNILELSMVFDNLISNSEKAGAKRILIDIKNAKGSKLKINFSDDGKGVKQNLLQNVEQIFELGVTTTEGSGIGLNHVREGLKKINGDIVFIGNGEVLKGASFEITIE